MKVILDMSMLAHAAFHTTGGLSYEGEDVGVIFGILKKIQGIMGFYQTNRLIFAFDSKISRRKKIYPEYKATRKTTSSMSDEERVSMNDQMRRLRTEILPTMGFQNIFHEPGYEADDLIAAIIEEVPGEYGIVSRDNDLWQLMRLAPIVEMFDPINKRATSLNDLAKTNPLYTPWNWVRIKAIAGDASDNIVGVKGVGWATAAIFVAHEGREKPNNIPQSRYDAIKEFIETEEFLMNIRLIELPLDHAKFGITLVDQERFHSSNIREVFNSLGFKSLLDPAVYRIWQHTLVRGSF